MQFTTPQGRVVDVDETRLQAIANGEPDPGEGPIATVDGEPCEIQVMPNLSGELVPLAAGDANAGHSVDAIAETSCFDTASEYEPDSGGGNLCSQCEHDPCICYKPA
jgi:hypothetical protein